MGVIVRYDPSFARRSDVVGHLGLSPEQKLTSALRMLAYGSPADQLDDYMRMGQNTVLEFFRNFCRAIFGMYSSTYLCAPTPADLWIQRGFPGMIGSIDCMHWEWRNCPTSWTG
ncbi:unnamed protein product [Linum trigynum]|uniref:Uncharacterized protein n=1 Tax=Linum trigynum TaxID=586398 RepID=A0AAV2E521_9ROSI